MYLTAMEEQLYLMQKRYLLTICLIRVKLNNSLFGASKPYKSSNEANTLQRIAVVFSSCYNTILKIRKLSLLIHEMVKIDLRPFTTVI